MGPTRALCSLFQEREVSKEDKSGPASLGSVCVGTELVASFPWAGMGESKALEVPQVRGALRFDPARLLLSFLTGFVVARWASYLLVPGGCLSWA